MSKYARIARSVVTSSRGVGHCLLIGLVCFAVSCEAHAGIAGLTRMASSVSATNPTGLNQPIFVTHAPGDRSRLFIAQRSGSIRILDLTTGSMVGPPFLSIPGVNSADERGFLGMAFHPDYASNGNFYTYSTQDGSAELREWSVSEDANVASTAYRTLLSIPSASPRHYGGWIGFQPGSAEANLYVALGDFGSASNAQDTTSNLRGKVLRINVDGDDFPADATRNYAIPSSNPFVAGKPNEEADDEIWSFGLRNPFRNSFDRGTGDLWVGDVGDAAREEIDFEAANSAGGANYGWPLREGLIQAPNSMGGPKPGGAVDPVYDYDRVQDAFGGSFVTGGYVYRGPDPTLQGKYFFLDAGGSNYWTFDPTNPFGTVANINSSLTPDTGSARFPVSFGEDAVGNLYIAYLLSSEVYRINTNAFTPGDFDGDADVDDDDLTAWTAGFGTATGATRQQGDADGDGDVDGGDFLAWQQNLGWSALNVGPPSTGVPEPTSVAMAFLTIGLLAARRRR